MAMLKANNVLVDSNGKRYVVTQLIDAGYTAEVYAAEMLNDQISSERLKVALKVMKPNLPKETQDKFWDEQQVLTSLYNFRKAELSNGETEPELRGIYTPIVYGSRREQGAPVFIAMEFIDGAPLTELAQSPHAGEMLGIPADRLNGASSSFGSLLHWPSGEAYGLLIFNQVLHTLQILHDRMQLSYLDFQLKNIYWLRHKQQIKIIDWGHLGRTERQPEDLIRVGAYLYQALTGKGGNWQTGESERALADRAGVLWEEMPTSPDQLPVSLSIGTRRLITKALNPNPDNRWQRASDMSSEIGWLYRSWQKPLGDVQDDAFLALRRFNRGKNQGRASSGLAEAVALSDLLSRRGGKSDKGETLETQLRDFTSSVSSEWGMGDRYYRTGQYDKAFDHWFPEAQSREDLKLFRKMLQGYIGYRYQLLPNDPIWSYLGDLVEALNDERWNQSRQLLTQANSGYVQMLQSDLEVIQSFQNGQTAEIQEQDYKRAIGFYQLTAQALAQLNEAYGDSQEDRPVASLHRKLLEREYGIGELDARIAICQEALQKNRFAEQVLAELDQFLSNKDLQAYEQQLLANLDVANQQGQAVVLQRPLIQHAIDSVNDNRFKPEAGFAFLQNIYAKAAYDPEGQLSLIKALKDAQAKLNQANASDLNSVARESFVHAVQTNDFSTAKQALSRVNSDMALLPTGDLEKRIEALIKNRSLLEAGQWNQLLQTVKPDRAQSLNEKISTKRRQLRNGVRDPKFAYFLYGSSALIALMLLCLAYLFGVWTGPGLTAALATRPGTSLSNNAEPTETATPTPTLTQTATPSPTTTPTLTLSPSSTPTETPTPTPTETLTPSPTLVPDYIAALQAVTVERAFPNRVEFTYPSLVVKGGDQVQFFTDDGEYQGKVGVRVNGSDELLGYLVLEISSVDNPDNSIEPVEISPRDTFPTTLEAAPDYSQWENESLLSQFAANPQLGAFEDITIAWDFHDYSIEAGEYSMNIKIFPLGEDVVDTDTFLLFHLGPNVEIPKGVEFSMPSDEFQHLRAFTQDKNEYPGPQSVNSINVELIGESGAMGIRLSSSLTYKIKFVENGKQVVRFAGRGNVLSIKDNEEIKNQFDQLLSDLSQAQSESQEDG